MIIRHVEFEEVAKSSFKRLVEYLTDSQQKESRIGSVCMSNCYAETIEDAITEVELTQSINTRSKADKTYHLLVSFQNGEKPSDDVLRDIEEKICTELGFKGHQRISVVHDDTDNYHMHIAINKINKDTFKIHEPFRAYDKMAQVAVEMEQKHNLLKDNHDTKKTLAQGKAASMEAHTGQESLLTYVKEKCSTELKNAPSWADFLGYLADEGINFRKRGNGYIFESGGYSVKASTVDRTFSYKKLNERLGEELPEYLQKEHYLKLQRAISAGKTYKRQPLAKKINVLWNSYTEIKQYRYMSNQQVVGVCRKDFDRDIRQFSRELTIRCNLIKLMDDSYLVKRVLYKQAIASHQKKIQKRRVLYSKQVDERLNRSKRAWKDWLCDQAKAGNAKALTGLRKGKSADAISVDKDIVVVKTKLKNNVPKMFDTITKEGTIIYDKHLREVNNTIMINVKNATPQTLQRFFNVLEERKLSEKYYFVGSEENKQILFEKMEGLKADHDGRREPISGRDEGIRGDGRGAGGTRRGYTGNTPRNIGRAKRRGGEWYKYLTPATDNKPRFAALDAREQNSSNTNSLRALHERRLAYSGQPAAGVLPSDARHHLGAKDSSNKPLRRGVRR